MAVPHQDADSAGTGTVEKCWTRQSGASVEPTQSEGVPLPKPAPVAATIRVANSGPGSRSSPPTRTSEGRGVARTANCAPGSQDLACAVIVTGTWSSRVTELSSAPDQM
ncbi:hypothetical protein [Streptomyces sp. NPDC056600]|uniref:hypothetical protein n=1 Tax=Streptomyces sp. NPDC056600 TaxID=3345874 RepID=UPI0036941CB4